jgi:hypothetical protein
MDPELEKKPAFDISVLLPVLLGVFSLAGILMVFMIGRFNANRPPAPAEDTATPFKYQLVGTEPGISTSELTEEPVYDLTLGPITGEEGEPSSNATQSPNQGLVVTAQQGGVSGPGSSVNTSVAKTNTSSSVIQTAAGNATDPIIILGTKKVTATSGNFVFRTHTPTKTPGPAITWTPSRTFAPTFTKRGNTSTPSNTPENSVPTSTPIAMVPSSEWYDDTYPFILYEGWSQTSDAGAFGGTLHVSNSVNSNIRFRFTGQQFRLKFQGAGSSLGEITIDINGQVFPPLSESNGTDEWVSPDLAYKTYNVTITHSGGGSVNIDAIIIPVFVTPTPSATPTPTPTSQ